MPRHRKCVIYDITGIFCDTLNVVRDTVLIVPFSQFPLYTLMVFDEWHNGIPVAFILTSRCAEADLTPWMAALNERMTAENPEWRPSAFIVDCAQGKINAIK